VLSVENGGVARARNLGIAEARGDLVAFLDSDDLWQPTKLQRQVALMNSRPDIGVCFTAATRVDAQGHLIGTMPARDYSDYCEALLLYSVIIPASCSTSLVRRDVALDDGGFDPAFSQTADWDYFLRLSQISRFAPIFEPLVQYRTHTGNMSSDIGLLERDTFAVLDKFFAAPRFAPYLPLRSRAYSNHWMICSGSYLHAGQIAESLRCLMRGLRADPANVGRPLGLPHRWLRRVTHTSHKAL
jgi:glycosyltransferase involved in cell wall biosynthesis